MSRITLDANLRERLNGLNERLEVCNEAGDVVGHFVPEVEYQQMLYRLAELQCPYSAKELDAMERETGGKSLEEFWRELGQA